MSAYYNENDPYAAQWLRNLIAAEHIAPGDVDERSIVAVRGDDLGGYEQCHFFAGIGGWSYAFRLSGWPDDRPVWTGSCPCQPFSAAGQRKGEIDSRHLWPEFLRLIAGRNPATVIGEQVASKLGREWLSRVFGDLEELGYAVAGADLCAAGIGAPHIRQRLFWMAHADGGDASAEGLQRGRQYGQRPEATSHPETTQGLQHPAGDGWQQRRPEPNWWGSLARLGDDGLWRRIDPSVEPLASGLPNRVAMLRGYGNAIVPQCAQAFIEAVMEVVP